MFRVSDLFSIVQLRNNLKKCVLGFVPYTNIFKCLSISAIPPPKPKRLKSDDHNNHQHVHFYFEPKCTGYILCTPLYVDPLSIWLASLVRLSSLTNAMDNNFT
ncbi:hypothetical protein BLOT_000305 [Blomia tropicalis]|nr:hypothetical protein BLOT_000305 [Blomia tropicalis]